MTPAPLRDALSTLHAAFRRPDIIGGIEDVTVELAFEAGHRFEFWLAANAPAAMRCDPDWIKTTEAAHEGAQAFRSVTIDGVRIKWPLLVDHDSDARRDLMVVVSVLIAATKNGISPHTMFNMPVLREEIRKHGLTIDEFNRFLGLTT